LEIKVPEGYVIAFEGNTVTNQFNGKKLRFTSAYNAADVLLTLVDKDFSTCVARCDNTPDCRGLFVTYASRYETCTLLQSFGAPEGLKTDLESYSIVRLGVDCGFGPWSPWSGCDCPGTSSRTRTVVRQPTPGGITCQTLGSFKEDRACDIVGVDCAAIYYGNCEAISCRACAEDEFVSRPCTRYTNTECAKVAPLCSSVEYQRRGPTTTSDRVCEEVRGPCGADEFEAAAPTETSNRVCSPITTTTSPTTTTTTLPISVDAPRFIFGRVLDADGTADPAPLVGIEVRVLAEPYEGVDTMEEWATTTGQGGTFSVAIAGNWAYRVLAGTASQVVVFTRSEDRKIITMYRVSGQGPGWSATELTNCRL